MNLQNNVTSGYFQLYMYLVKGLEVIDVTSHLI
jgi:hypothetical protein